MQGHMRPLTWVSVLRKLRPFWLTARMQGAGTATLLQLWTKKKEEPNKGEALRRPGGAGAVVRDTLSLGARPWPPGAFLHPPTQLSSPQSPDGAMVRTWEATPQTPLYQRKVPASPPLAPLPGWVGIFLTQELGARLVGAERLHLLPVLADQVEPRGAGHRAVELGRDVLLNLPPG